ncbi:MAG: nuclear transport factor 2 family protein [Gemmatimonadota bacterium]|nr:nuclear transport factor 2 family protein [Gemmatimonadota bacterium]
MKPIVPVLVALVLVNSAPVSAQSSTTPQDTNEEQEILDLSRMKWRWMAEQNADTLAALFHEKARFVHMSGTWGTAAEIEIIRSGSIHYKHADVHEVVVEVLDDTAILWNRITLVAVVRGNEVTNPFTVTEVYRRQAEGWKMLAMTFSSVRSEHHIER